MKSAMIAMIGNQSMRQEFDVIVYGRSADDLLKVGSPVVREIARRFPDHTSSPFLVKEVPRRGWLDKEKTP